MVAEVEIRNTVESIKVGSSHPAYSFDPETPMIYGHLTNEGQLLNIEVDREIATDFIRGAYLFYGVINLTSKITDYHLIEAADPVVYDNSLPQQIATAYSFDISSVLTIPRNTVRALNATEITIDLFTYEANITDNTGNAIYGTKRLTVPYRAEMDPNVAFPPSTDGWYPFCVIDFSYRDINGINTTTFFKNDIVWWFDGNDATTPNGAAYITSETTTLKPTAVGSPWVEATTEDILTFSLMPPPGGLTSAETVIGANAMITRYAKKEFIRDLLLRTSYKPHDNKKALYALLKISALREDVIRFLTEGNLVMASYTLDMITYQYDSMFDDQDSITLRQVNTNYTV